MEGEMSRATKKICRDLGLPAGDSYTQDWVYELPEEFRTCEYLFQYLRAYPNPDYGDDEKRLLMQLMLDIANDLLEDEEPLGYDAWSRLVDLLREAPDLHRGQIEHWALPGEPLEDAFRLTPLVRLLREEL